MNKKFLVTLALLIPLSLLATERKNTSRISYPIGGLGTGCFCVEGNGAISNMNVRYRTEMNFEPTMFAALHVAGKETIVLEGQVQDWKKFGQPQSTKGYGGTWGLPRYKSCRFSDEFPFASLQLRDDEFKINTDIVVWNPFIPTQEDDSSLPVAGVEYTFTNRYHESVDLIFAYNSQNFLDIRWGGTSFKPVEGGFCFHQPAYSSQPWQETDFAIYSDEPDTKVNLCWFRGASFDPFTMCWNDITSGNMPQNPETADAPGASLYIPFTLAPGESRTIHLYMSWYIPLSPVREGKEATAEDMPSPPAYDEFGNPVCYVDSSITASDRHRPWYAGQFRNIDEVISYWKNNYSRLKHDTRLFTDALYASTLPDEVMDAVTSNLTILKSPTVWRQADGRLWNWEGCGNEYGSCYGSCTHVWNYAQATAHLFPRMERSLRETEFFVNQREDGHQAFRAALPIRPIRHDFHAAADGQLGGILKVYRDWRIYGNDNWLKLLFPYVKSSLDYCIRTWDPDRVGAIREPHHNTYDIEFWGANGMINSYYAGALAAYVRMGEYLGEDVSDYTSLLDKCVAYTEDSLFNGEYFIQTVDWHGLHASDPTEVQSAYASYSPEALELMYREGPKYQYGDGCLSDGVVGSWLTLCCGLDELLDTGMVTSHLNSVYMYNLRKSLRKHANPQRSTFATGDDGGLLLCSWPKGGKLSLPFIYSNEVWTGIEYQVASHLIFEGEVKKGLEIVRTARSRYDGTIRNPFNEYECGAWYGRALSSYSLLQALTGVRYDAVSKTLCFDSRIGNDFKVFLSTETGFGIAGLRRGKPFINVYYGNIDITGYEVR